MKHGALKPLKQRRSPRRYQTRLERQHNPLRQAMREYAPAGRADHQRRVEEMMKPERERQERKRVQRMLRWFSRYPGYEDVIKIEGDKLMKTWDNQRGDIDPPEEITLEQEFIPQINPSNPFGDIPRSSTMVANELPPN